MLLNRLTKMTACALLALLPSINAHAQSGNDYLACLTSSLSGSESALELYINTLEETSARFRIAPEILVAIKLTESGRSLNPEVVNHNTNGTVDRGYYQVNSSVWLPVLHELGLPLDDHDMHDVRLNSLIAGWILRRKMDRFPESPYQAVAHYHRGGGNSDHANNIRGRYMSLFMPHLRRLVERCRPGTPRGDL